MSKWIVVLQNTGYREFEVEASASVSLEEDLLRRNADCRINFGDPISRRPSAPSSRHYIPSRFL
jgi:DNA-binding transcriptional LysR family regulator